MKHKSFEIYNLFKNIITFYKFSVTAFEHEHEKDSHRRNGTKSTK